MFIRRRVLAAIVCAAMFAVPGSAGAIERQHQTAWCWASAIQEVLAEQGIEQSQEQIVARLTGWPRNRPATTSEVTMLLQSYGLDAQEAGRPGTPQELYRVLSQGEQVIAFIKPNGGVMGHFVVFEGMDRDGRVTVADPWSGRTFVAPIGTVYGWNWRDTVVVS
jgi:ABC-type bacteriocin/lantibiotic exporter with double-glycine peptidase domain